MARSLSDRRFLLRFFNSLPMMTTEQHARAKALFVEQQALLGRIRVLRDELTGPGYDPADDVWREALSGAVSSASDARLHLLDAYPKTKDLPF